MRVTHAALRPTSGPAANLGELTAGLNAYATDSPGQSPDMVAALTHLLLGKEDPRWSGIGFDPADARIAVGEAAALLRRSGERNAARLTLNQELGKSGSISSPSDWLGPLPEAIAGQVFFSAAGEIDPLGPLLTPEVAEAFKRITATPTARGFDPLLASRASDNTDLFRQRDDLVERIEKLLSARRHESEAIDGRLTDIQRQHAALASDLEEVTSRRHSIEAALAAHGARTRYEELSRSAEQTEGEQAALERAPRIDQLDSEVERWRASLAELEQRESQVRAELARTKPADNSPQLTLADQRASLAVAQRLIVDLESEVARFASTADAPHPVITDAHPRLNPLVELLGRHVDKLAGLVSEQERAQRALDLASELDQLERTQSELRRQVDRLLGQRQVLSRANRSWGELEQAHVGQIGSDAEWRRFERESDELKAEAERLREAITEFDRERDDLSARRERLLDQEDLARLQRELDATQAKLRAVGSRRTEVAPGAALRASDVLVRLTDGIFTELRLQPGGRSVEVRHQRGHFLTQPALSAHQQRLVAWSLRLALADASHAAGVAFPLVLDDPFAELDDQSAANLAVALDDYARRGRQVILITRRQVAIERLRSLGVSVRSLQAEAEPIRPEPVAPQPTQPTVREEIVRRGLLLDVADDIERFPVPIENRVAAFHAARVRTVGDLIGADPSALAEELSLEGVTPELVALWQAHVALVCFVPGLELPQAKRLAECGVLNVEDLAASDTQWLAAEWDKRYSGGPWEERIAEWVELAADGELQWRESGYADLWARNRQERRRRIDRNADRRTPIETKLSNKPSPKTQKTKEEPRFYLEVSSPVEAAPSIGPKRAELLTELGVAKVSDLLDADPEQLADQIGDSRVDTAKIVAWQHQANLVCRIPGLRGHDAQVLVGCGFTTPEEIASMKPSELLEFVEPFCETKQGQRCLRGSAKPDLAEVANWIQWARARRKLGVA